MVRTLVTPERTVHFIESRDALKAFAESRRPRIDAKQEGNLRQLLGFDRTANGGPRHEGRWSPSLAVADAISIFAIVTFSSTSAAAVVTTLLLQLCKVSIRAARSV